MKQLELNVTIKKADNLEFPYEMIVNVDGKPNSTSWYRGKTAQEVIDIFYKAFSDKQTRYWHMLEEK